MLFIFGGNFSVGIVGTFAEDCFLAMCNKTL